MLANLGGLPILAALIVLDVSDHPVGRWFDTHALTTDAIVGLVVLVVTVLNVDRVVGRRQRRDRAQVMAAQVMIVGRQAQRTTDQVRASFEDASVREDASDELRTYMTLLLVSAPVMIEDPPARLFLERAQRLAGELSWMLSHYEDGKRDRFGSRLDTLADSVRAAARPLMQTLNLAQLAAVAADEEPAV